MHTIGAFAVILDAQRRVLLCHRTDIDAWNLPGGRVESGESPWEAVVREVLEETGLLVRVESLLGVYSVERRADVVFNFSCVEIGGALLASSPEARSISWFGQAEVPPNTLPRHANRIQDAFNASGLKLASQV